MEEMSVTQVAEILGKTDRTIRNYIKEGRVKARRIENQFGWEYRVYDLGEFAQSEINSEKIQDILPPAMTAAAAEVKKDNKTETALQVVSQENQHLWDENRQLREINNRLAYDLGGRDQRIKELEKALEQSRNLLATPSGNGHSAPEGGVIAQKSWWKRLFGR